MAFYDKFSPDGIAESLTEAINKNQDMLTDALLLISTSDKIEESIRNKMFICGKENNHDISNATHITKEFAKSFLIYKKILIDDPVANTIIFSKSVEQKRSKISLDTTAIFLGFRRRKAWIHSILKRNK